MKRTSVFRLLPVVFVLALAAPIHGQSFGFPWWKDAQFQKELTIQRYALDEAQKKRAAIAERLES